MDSKILRRTATLVLSLPLMLSLGCADPVCNAEDINLQNLGVDFQTWDGVPGSTAGDFLFSGNDPMISAFGTDDGYHVPGSASLDLYLDETAEIVAPVEGTISRFQHQEEGDDYEIEIQVGDCVVHFDHIKNPQVEKGQSVVAGQALGNPGPWNGNPGIGMTEIALRAGDTMYCPVDFLDPAVAPAVEASLLQLMADTEVLFNDTSIFDEDAMVVPGCYLPSITF